MADLVMSRRRERNSEDDRSRIVRFGLRLVDDEVVDAVVERVDDNTDHADVVRDAAAAAAAGRVGGTNASTDKGPQHHTTEELPVPARATSRAESINFVMVFAVDNSIFY